MATRVNDLIKGYVDHSSGKSSDKGEVYVPKGALRYHHRAPGPIEYVENVLFLASTATELSCPGAYKTPGE